MFQENPAVNHKYRITTLIVILGFVCFMIDLRVFADVPEYSYRVVQKFPHDRSAYTQGLIYHEGFFLESTGLYGQSTLRRVEVETGEILRQHSLPYEYFAEGIALVNQKIVQLTWQSRIGFIYDLDTFENLDQFQYSTEGWGITSKGARVVMSDGTSSLYFLNPDNLQRISTLQIYDSNGPVRRLNELEWIEDEIWANIWLTDRIARIQPENGEVVGWVNLTGLLPADERDRTTDVLNGIAYDAENKRIFVTGKNWPWIYEIEVLRESKVSLWNTHEQSVKSETTRGSVTYDD